MNDVADVLEVGKRKQGSSSNDDLSLRFVVDALVALVNDQKVETRGLLYRFGFCIGSFPVVTLFLTMAVTGLFGAVFVTEVSVGHNLAYLWIPDSTQAASSYRRVLPLLSAGLSQSRKVSVLVEPFQSSNILTHSHFERIWELDNDLNNIRAGASNVSLDNICLTTRGKCISLSPLHFWSNYSQFKASIHDTHDLLKAISAHNYSDGRPVDRDRLWGKGSYELVDDLIVSARGFVLRYGFRSSERTRFIREWEEELLHKLNSAQTPYSIILATPYIHTSYWDEFDTLIGTTMPLVAACFLSMFIFVCIAFSYFEYMKKRKRVPKGTHLPIKTCFRVILSLGCVISVICSTIVGFGICTHVGKLTASSNDLAGSSLPFNTLIMMLPFLLMAIGVDDAFIITNAFNHTDEKSSIPKRVGQALAIAGPAIFYTTATDCVAFALGACLTTTPVIRIFCIYAAVCICIDFSWQISLFLAVLSLDEKRRTTMVAACTDQSIIPNNRHYSTPCQHRPIQSSNRSIVARYAVAVTTSRGRCWTLIIMLVQMGLCVWFSSLVELQSPTTDLLSSDSYVFRYLTHTDELNLGESAFMQYGVFMSSDPPPMDALGSFNTPILPAPGSADEMAIFELFGQTLLSPVVQRSLINLLSSLASMKYGSGPVDDWITSFNAWCLQSPIFTNYITTDGYFEGTRSKEAAIAFQRALTVFLLDPEYSHYSNSLFLRIGNSSTNLTSPMYQETQTEIVGTVLSVYFVDTGPMRSKVAATEEMYSLTDHALVEASCFHESFAKISFFSGIWTATIINAAVCFGVVAFTSMIFLRSSASIVTVLICLTVIYIELLGLMGLAGVPLNQVTTVVLLSSFGLAVDSVAHITHAAHQSSQLSTYIKVEKALRDVGGSVFLGGMTSFVGVCPLILSKAQFFKDFFVLFTFLIGCALLHGFIFAPALLSLLNELVRQVQIRRRTTCTIGATCDLSMNVLCFHGKQNKDSTASVVAVNGVAPCTGPKSKSELDECPFT